MRVHVAGQHDRVGCLRLFQSCEDAIPVGGVAVPFVHRVLRLRIRSRCVAREHRHLLSEHRPRCAHGGELLEQPPLLLGPQHRPRRIGCRRAAGDDPAAARLIAAELPGVENAHVHQRAELQPAIHADVRTAWKRGAPERHRLVVRLVGSGAPKEEHFRRCVVLLGSARVVVVDLVVVKRHDERRRGVRRDQVAIGFVERIAVAVIDDGKDFLAVVLPYDRRIPSAIGAIFVDVVAGVEHEVESLVGNAAERGEVARLVMVAAADRKAELIDDRIRRRRRFRSPHLTDFAAGMKPIPVLTAGLQALDFDVDGVSKFRPGNRRSLLLDGAERLVARDLPANFNSRHRHSAAIQRVRREPGPQHDAVRPGITRRHAKSEGVGAENGLRENPRRCERLE